MVILSKRVMHITSVLFIYSVTVNIHKGQANKCGCKTMRPCYEAMLEELLDGDEVACIEDATIGLSTVTVFLTALKQYCNDVFDFTNENMTYEGRSLYEVHLADSPISVSDQKPEEQKEQSKPIFIIEAGQEGGSESVMLALYVIEQLVACEQYKQMLQNVRWVILPCTNPDGQEYARFSRIQWKKNLMPSQKNASFGVDLTRNFDTHWSMCPRRESSFSQIYRGPSAFSEKETIFIKNVLNKYKKDAKIYLSIKRDGHSINYPYAHKKDSPHHINITSKIAGEVSARVNQRTGGINIFSNNSIFESEGKAHCGHSVDYAYDLGIILSYEMRVFLASDNRIISKFQTMPRGYRTSLRNGYFSGIRELYNALTNEKKYGRL